MHSSRINPFRMKYVLTLAFIALFTFLSNAQNAALDFDGTDDYVRVLDHSGIDFTSTMTLEAWINLPNVTGTRAIISKYFSGGSSGTNTSYQLTVSGGALSLSMNESDESFASASQSTGSITTNTWYHVAGVANGSGSLLLYVNGLLVGSGTYDNTIYSGSRNLLIGRTRQDDSFGATDGVIDEVRLWSVARTQEEIATNMNHDLTGSETGLEGYYQFNDGTAGADNTGDVFTPDATGTANGVMTNMALNGSSSNYVTGFTAINHALDFDGTDDHVVVSDDNSLDFTSTFTLEAWINLASTTGSRAIISKYFSGTSSETSYRLQVLDGLLRLQVNNSGATAVSAVDQTIGSISASTWHHIAAVADGSGNLLLYMDGDLAGTGSYDNTVYVGTRDLFIGKARTEDAASITDGSIDEVRLWNVARTCSEILSTKDVELVGNESGLVAYYNFNHGVASGTNSGLTTLPDLSGSDNDGTVTSFALSSTSSNYLDASGNSVTGNAPADQPEINVRGNSNDIADGSTTINTTIDTDFGTQASSNAIVYTIQNTGSGTLNITSIVSSGTNSGDFVVSGAPSTVAATGSETFTVTFTPGDNGVRTATITINSDDCDEAAYDFAVQGSGPAPGGLSSDVQVWLKASEGFAPSQWDDQSGNSNHATQGTGTAQPSSTSEAINFNTAITFDGSADFMTLTNDAGAMGLDNSDWEAFFVANASGSAIQFLMSGAVLPRYELSLNNGSGLRLISGNAIMPYPDIGSSEDFTDGVTRILGGTLQSSGTGSPSVNGLFGTSITGHQTTATDAISIGYRAGQNLFFLNGQIGEMVLVGDALSATDRLQVLSYLALKYGITLDQTSAQDYLASDGATEMWDKDATGASTYDNDIAGIGRDDVSELGQVKSKSENTDGIITIEAESEGTNASPSFTDIADLEFLTWANNDGAATWTTTGAPCGYQLLSRQWSVQEVGDVGTLSFSLDVGDTDFDIPTATAYYLVKDSDDDGDLSDETPIALVDGGGDIWTTTALDFADGEEFTIASDYTVEINLQGNSVTIADGNLTPDTSDSTDIGTVMGGQIVNYTIQNTGTDDLTVSSIDISGTNASDFTVSGLTLPATIAGSSDATFQITFVPSATGTRSATVTVNSDDCDEAAYDFAIQGSTTTKSILINEVVTEPQQDWSSADFYNANPGGSGGSNDEWIELYIATDDLDLNDYTIELRDGTDVIGDLTSSGAFQSSNYFSLTGGRFTKTKAGDYLILGNVSGGAINNTNDTIQIRNGSMIIDQVIIGGSGTAPSGNSNDATDESVARIPNAADTYDNSADFVLTRATLAASNAPSGTVVINEVVTDPFTDWETNGFDGSDGGVSATAETDEWVELYIGTSGLNLTGWTISLEDGSGDIVDQSLAAGGAFTVSNYITSGSGSFINTEAGDYLVLGNPVGSGTTQMNNDVQITLKDASGTTIDQVKLGGGTGEAPSGSNSAFNSEAIARYPNATDSGTDDADFIQTRPTLGSTNSPVGTVVINEIVTDPQQDWSTNNFDGTIGDNALTDSDEWIELYIATDSVNLTGWTMTIDDGVTPDVDNSVITTAGSFGDTIYFSNNSGSFANTRAGDFYVLGNAAGAMNNDVLITLRDASGNIIDEVELGDDEAGDGAGDGAPDGSANGGDATGISDEAIARIPNGTDTDNDVNDFAAVPASLGAMNSIAQLPGIGNALPFTGTDYVLIADDANLEMSGDFTIEFWLNTSEAGNNIILEKGNLNTEYSIQQLSGNTLGLNVNGIMQTNNTYNDGNWHHVAVVYRGTGDGTIYVDGIDDTNPTNGLGTPTYSTGAVNIGTRNGNSGFSIEGSIDEVRFWSDERTQEEVVENMMGLVDPSATGLVAYYRFDQSSGTTLFDLTSNNLDGTLTNMAGTEWTAAGWEIFSQNAAILQSGGTDVSSGSSGELTLTDVSFLNDDNDYLIAGHDNEDFLEVTADLPSGSLLVARYERSWNISKNDASGTSNGSVTMGFDLGAAPDVTYTYYLLERTGTSGDFAIVPIQSVNPNGNSIEFMVDASAIDDGSYYTLGRSDAGVGNALDFDGTGDYVLIDHDASFDLSGPFTIELWLKTSETGNVTLFEKGDNNVEYSLQLLSGRIVFNGNTDWERVSTGTYNDGNWHHVAFVYRDGSTDDYTLYADGIDDTSAGTIGSPNYAAQDGDLTIGGRVGNTAATIDGIIDEVRVWSDERTQQEVLENMFANLTGDEANLVAYYRFNQGIGDGNTNLPDLGPTGHSGTLTNFSNLNGATASSNYVTSDRSSIDQSSIISNGGNLTDTDGELTLTSTQTAGDFLQDANDYLRWNNDGGSFSETTADVPTGTLITRRYAKTWVIDKNDAVGTANGNVTFSFDLGGTPDPDLTYFLLSRASTSGEFSIVEALSSAPSGNNMTFTVDAGQITDNYYFTLGRTDVGAGNALDFDGNNDLVDLGSQILSASAMTVEAWVNGSSFSNTGRFNRILALNYGSYTTDNPFALFVNSSGQIGYVFGTGGTNNDAQVPLSFSPTLSTDTWYHVALTFDGSTKSLYVDGILMGTVSNTGTFTNTNTEPLLIGDFDNTTSDNGEWEGEIDEVRVWSDVRTEQEIRDNLNRKLDVANESNLVAYYQFNSGIADGTNTGLDVLTDRSGSGNGGTLANLGLTSTSSNWVSSNAVIGDQAIMSGLIGAGNALDFDGVDEFVEVSDNASLESSSTLTVEAWVRPDAVTSFRGIVSRYFTAADASNVFALQIDAGNYGFLINESDNNLVSATATATASTWTHVAGVADGSEVHIYLDGILMASTAYDGTITSNSSRNLYIGRYRNDSFGQYDGLIDEVRIWNTARTGAEIQANMFEELSGSESGLVAYYRFDESAGTTLDDDSPNTNTGTLNNMEDADWVDASGREPFKTNGAGNLNSAGTWKGGSVPGASQILYVQHDLTVDTDLTVDDLNLVAGNTLTLNASQTLTVTGNLINNGTITGSGKIQFTSGTPMISGGTFSNLELNGGSPMLCGNTTITGDLTITSGVLQLLDYDFTLNSGATITGGDASNYIETLNQNSSGGSLIMELGSSDGPTTYPIGTSTNYTPITFTNLGSTATFAIRTFDGIYTNNTSGTELTSDVIRKTWDVIATGSGYNVTLTIQWNAADEAGDFDRNNMYISLNDGAGWINESGLTSATEISSGIYSATVSGVDHFTGVGGGGIVITPITLLDFYAEETDQGIELTWHTAVEENNEKFIIERSPDGIDFEVLGEVPGAGDSQEIIKYTFLDGNPLTGESYYRFMQVDFDGAFEYSPIIRAVNLGNKRNLIIYPNPFRDKLYIGLPQEDVVAQVRIMSMTGQVAINVEVEPEGRFLVIPDLELKPGVYLLEVTQGGEKKMIRLVRE